MFLRFVLATLTVACLSCASTKVNVEPIPKYSPIARLLEDGRYTCTAFVISDKYAVTAAHCVSDGSLFGFQMGEMTIANAQGHQITSVKVIGMDPRVDFAVLKGDFRSFKKVRLDNGKYTWTSKNWLACGYPHGSISLKCSNVTADGTRLFQLQGKGELLFPGHSGGPLFDKDSGYVIGVNSAVSENGTLYAPVLSVRTMIELHERRF